MRLSFKWRSTKRFAILLSIAFALSFLVAFALPIVVNNVSWLANNSKQYGAPFHGLWRGHGETFDTGLTWTWMEVHSPFRVVVTSEIADRERLALIAAFSDQANPGFRKGATPPGWTSPAEEPLLPSAPHSVLDTKGLPNHINFRDEAWGWPMPALAFRVTSFDRDETDPEVVKLTGIARPNTPHLNFGLTVNNLINEIGWSIGRWDWSANACEYLPTRVLWWPMLLNTIVMLCLIRSPWLAASLFRLARTRLRFRRGQCVFCGYSLAGLKGEDKCPECGAAPAAGRVRS